MPETFSNVLEFDRKEFIASLERIAVLADQHNNVVKISTNKESQLLKITAEAQDLGSGSESIPIQYDGDDIEIAFNSRYLLD